MVSLSDNMRGSLLTVGAMTGFTVNDAFMKALSDELGLTQALVLRGIGVTLLFVAAGAVLGGLHWPRRAADRRWIALRGVADAAATFLYLTALFHMPLANATAILQAVPLTVTLAAALMFREPLGWRRLTAIGIGFVGVLLIVRPGPEGFSSHAIFAILAVALISLRDLTARKMSPAVPSLLVAGAGSALVTMIFAVGAAFEPWVAVSPVVWAQMLGAILSIFCGYYCLVASVRVGELGVSAPFRYSALVVALVIGVVVFDDWPAPLTLLGAAIVVATGLFTWMRERAAARRAAG